MKLAIYIVCPLTRCRVKQMSLSSALTADVLFVRLLPWLNHTHRISWEQWGLLPASNTVILLLFSSVYIVATITVHQTVWWFAYQGKLLRLHLNSAWPSLRAKQNEYHRTLRE